MPTEELLILTAVFFFTSVVSVITGSTSLITVPAMIALGMEAHRAVATNMLALTFMSIGGSLPFVHANIIRPKRLPTLALITVFGSALGALLLLRVPVRALQIVIAVAMIGVGLFSLVNKKFGETRGEAASSKTMLLGYATTFGLAVYGGFFSGGYVTMLTAAFVLFFGMTLLEAVASTKVMNVFSSGVAATIFIFRGVVDLRLGLILGASMFLGALLGGRITLLLNAVWIRRIFVAAVLCLAGKMLFFQP
ncbi:MAG TPA: sulfite exporter TauE/SafE family protein [Terriglobales bacterium]|nr:sulfite exporter TauE/SafE family protein [Terriglobales bacterium]